MFALKKILGTLLMPLPFASVLVAMGLVARVVGWVRASRIAMWTGVVVAVSATLGPVGNGLLRPLENRYGATLDASLVSAMPRYIVVLGSGYRPSDDLPVTAALSADSVVRLTEAVRLYRQLPGSQLIVSGGAVKGWPPTAFGYAEAARALGVPAASIIMIDNPLDTGAEIRAIRERVADAAVLLVTSAAHMPRAMAHCARVGVRAVPAPTGHFADPFEFWSALTWLPAGGNLRKTETALHEYLGLMALSIGVT